MLLKKEFRFVVLLILCVVGNQHLFGQNLGFEWIKTYQPYYKFKIGSNGTYRINAAALQLAGVNTATLNPKRIQLFYQGAEVPVYIAGEADNQFNASDFIEFYGSRNDGAIDTFIYQNKTWQPNMFNGLFTDTAVYFLTILPDTTLVLPLRYTNQTDYDFTGLQPEQYFMDTVYIAPTETYLDGPDLLNASEKYTGSEFEAGEGWASERISFAGRTFEINTPAPNVFGPAPQIEYKIIGASNARLANQLVFPNHHVKVSISTNNAAFTTLTDFKYNAYDAHLFAPNIGFANIGSGSTYLKVEAVNDLSMPSDFTCLSYALITYARDCNLNGKRQKWLKVVHHQANMRTFMQVSGIGSGQQTNAYVLDVTNLKRIPTLFSNGTAQFVLNNTGKPHQIWLFDSTQAISVTGIQAVSFPVINPTQNYEFVMVTHPILEPAATNYTQYRQTSYNVLKVYSEQLYDYYFYGNKHPFGIRRLMQHLLTTQTQKPKYLLLAGRSYQCDKARHLSLSATTYLQNYNNNIVPAIGVPGADALFSNGIVGDGFSADVPFGRIPASTSQELQNYLDKLVYYETSPDSIQAWRKNNLHISGGNSIGEQLLYKTVLNQNGLNLSGENIGAKIISYNKSSNLPTQVDLRDKIIAHQNEGINMLSFYGHASLTILDVDIGGINDISNTNKYPLYYFSGCNVGNASEVDPTTGGAIYAKEYICAANKGAIGWLAHGNYSFSGYLEPIISRFYNIYGKQLYGQSLGNIMVEVCKQLSNSSPITKSHSIQWMLQGDPAVKLYSPHLPDYAVTSSDFYLENSSISTQDEFLNIGLIIKNLAKTDNDSFHVSITRRLPSNQVIAYPSKRIAAIYNTDTIKFQIETLGELALGNNTFDIKVDALNEVNEIAEINNMATASLFIPGNGCAILQPMLDDVVGTDTVWLTVQNNNILSTNSEFLIEVDTSANFNSMQKISFGPIKSSALLRQVFVPTATDTITYYWRARLNIPDQQGGKWTNSVFTFIPGHSKAWMQRTFDRKTDFSTTEFLLVDDVNKLIDFTENSKQIKVTGNRVTHGGRGVFFDGENQNPGNLGCVGGNGFSAIAIDKRTLNMFINPNFPLNCQNVIDNNNNPLLRKLYYYAFPNNSTGFANFSRFVDSLPIGTYVAVFSQYDCGSTAWPQALRNSFAKLGSTKVAAANHPDVAFSMLGIVGATPGVIAEDTSTLLGEDKDVVTETVLMGKWYTATGVSKSIGPATAWQSLHMAFNPTENDGNDHNSINVYGINNSGVDTLLISNAPNNTSLSGINAANYPYLKLSFNVLDTVYRTPDQLRYWMIKYEGVPEGTISIADTFSFYNTQLEQGDTLRFVATFRNISDKIFDSVPVLLRVIDANRSVVHTHHHTFGALQPNQIVSLHHKLSTYHFGGQYAMEVYFNDGPQLEQTKTNNYLFKAFNVKADKINPLLDVTFDGYRIVNGDFVSPKPVIRIASKDNSRFKLQNDTGLFALFVKSPTTDFKRIDMNDVNLVFKPATNSENKAYVEYSPTFTEDGRYTLKVSNKDASGNTAGSNYYEVDFEVMQKSTITHFFPYPNPATTNVRFVFTLTGASVPDQLLIRIMTVSGRVVKEITQDEFGSIKIGQNISAYGWDGTDNFGDRLANGVYLYQVLTKVNGSSIEHRSTDKGDSFFVQNVGKIYLMK